MTTKQKLALWLGSLTMLAAWHVPAEAAVTCRLERGIQKCYGSIWSNELAGNPVLEFPLNCARTGTCQFTFRLDYSPVALPDNPLASCLATVDFGESILPLSDWNGQDGTTGGLAIREVAEDSGDMGPIRPKVTLGFRNEFYGRNYEILWSIGALTIYPSLQLCRIEVTAFYHPDSRAVHNRGMIGP